MSVLDQKVHLRYLHAVDAPPRNSDCTERGADGVTNSSEIQTGAVTSRRLPPSADSDGPLYWLMLVVGAIPVAAAFVKGGTWGVGPTVGAFFCVFAGRALVMTCIVRLRELKRKGHSRLHHI